MDTFAINRPVDEMTDALITLPCEYPCVSSRVENDRRFGDGRQIKVALLDRIDSLLKLHENTLEVLGGGKIMLNDPQSAHGGFLSRATVRGHPRLNKDDEIRFTSLSIVDMFLDGDLYDRKILNSIRLGN